MTAWDELYSERKEDIQALASPLFEASEVFVRNRGAFLPHGAVLLANGEVQLIAAAPPEFEKRAVCPAEVLPLLHDALRQAVKKNDAIVATAVSEDVTITPEGGRATRAMKVLIEHMRGLTVALYVPFRRKLLKGYVFEEMIAISVTSEIRAWTAPGAA